MTTKQLTVHIVSFLLLFLFVHSTSFAQEKRTVLTKKEYDRIYQENIKKSRIAGVYIPVDEEDAINEIKALSPGEGLKSFSLIANEWEAAKKLHFGLGRWMDVNWSFTEGSRLSHHLKKQGVLHPDDMTTYLLVLLHRTLNAKPLDNKEIVEKLAIQRKEIARSKIDKVLSEEIKKK